VERESAQPVQSNLTSPGVTLTSSSQALGGFVTGLLTLLKFIAAESDRQQSDTFCRQLDRYAAAVADESDASKLGQAREQCLKESEEFFHNWRKHLGDREQELRDVIDLLTNAIQTLSKDNQEFQAEVTASNERMHSYCDLEDIRELKVRLAQEVAQLKDTITEKQKRDAGKLVALSERVTVLQSKLEEVEQKAQTDGLTGLYNRASFDERITELVNNSEPFVLALFDIDNFKQVNDKHGHQIGDRVIISAALKLRDATRASDFIARYGGEEFVVIQPGSKLEHSLPRLSALLKNVAATNYEYTLLGEKRELSFTLSAGLTEFVPGDTVESVVARADSALYQAKHQGKNRALALKRTPTLMPR